MNINVYTGAAESAVNASSAVNLAKPPHEKQGKGDALDGVAAADSKINNPADVHGNAALMEQLQEEEKREEEEKRAEPGGDKLLNWVKGSVLPITGAAYQSSKIMSEQATERDMKMSDALAKIRRDIIRSVNGIKDGTLALLETSGISVSKATVAMLSSAVKSAVQAGFTESGEPMTEEALASALENYAANESEGAQKKAAAAVSALAEEGLPLTDTNLDSLLSVSEKASEITRMTTRDKTGFLRGGREMSVNALFTAVHSADKQSEGAPVKNMSDKQWSEMENGVKSFLRSGGIEISAENLETARLLISNDIPVSKENIAFINGGLTPKSMTALLKDAAKRIASGESPFDVKLYEDDASDGIAEGVSGGTEKPDRAQLFARYKKTIERLKDENAADNALRRLVAEGSAVTLERIAQKSVEDGGLDITPENSARYLSERIKLMEIRLRLTLTAASGLSRAGVSIDTMELQQAIDAMKEVERKNNEAALRISGAPVSSQNTETLSRYMFAAANASNVTDNVRHGILTGKIEFNLEETGRYSAREMREKYEASSTAPNAKFGDSVKKVLDKAAALLRDIDIEDTEENVKAAQSLIRTGEEVNSQNIGAVKAINNKIEFVSNYLTPAISAQMIKDRFNPLTAHIDEVIAYIDKFNEVYGEKPIESVQKAIFDMDKNSDLSKEERKSLIAMYKMLNAITKNDTASAAVIAKSKKSLTFENLLEAGQYYDKSKSRRSVVDKKLDLNDGGIEKVVTGGMSIRGQLESAYSNSLNALAESGISAGEFSAAAAEANMGQTAKNVELAAAVNEVFGQLAGASQEMNAAENITFDIDRAVRSAKNARVLNSVRGMSEADIERSDIRELLNDMDEFMENVTEDGNTELTTAQTRSYSEFKGDLSTLANAAPQQLAWLLSANLPLTVGNIKTLKALSENKNLLGEKIEELNETDEMKELAKSGDTLNTAIEDMLETLIDEGADGVYSAISSRLSEISEKAEVNEKIEMRTTEIRSMLNLLEKSAEKDNYLQIPLKLHDKLGTLNIYMLNSGSKSERAYLRLEFSGLGAIRGGIDLSGETAKITLEAENERAVGIIAENESVLRSLLEEIEGIDGNLDISIALREGKAAASLPEATFEESISRRAPAIMSENSAASYKGAASMDVRL